MKSFLSLPFLTHKIGELQQALFFSLGESVLKLSPRLVNSMGVDDLGQIWFVISRPSQQIQELDKEFLAQLDFVRKGKEFYLKVLGKAFIVYDPEEINCLHFLEPDLRKQVLGQQHILVKFKIQYADYFEKVRQRVPNNPFEKALIQLYGWLADHRPVLRRRKMAQIPFPPLRADKGTFQFIS